MTHKTLIRFSLLLFIVQSCFPKTEPTITIINNSDDTIQDVYFWPSQLDTSNGQISIEPNKKFKDKFNLTGVETDGSYLVSFRRSENSDIEAVNFGYFTLGASLHRNFTVTIKSDTVIVNSR